MESKKQKRTKNQAEGDGLIVSCMKKLSEITKGSRKFFPSYVKCRAVRLTHFLDHCLDRPTPGWFAFVSGAFVPESTDDFCFLVSFCSCSAVFWALYYSVLILVLLAIRDISHLLMSHLKLHVVQSSD